MSPDDYQQAWRAESSQTRVSIDAGALLTEVRRTQKELRLAISWNDFGEMGILVVLLPVWIYLGITTASPWTWYLMVPAIVWGAGFQLVVRARLKQAPNDPDEPLLSGVKDSLALVEHQIWLQRNVFWWSQLPMAVAMLAFFFHCAWLWSDGWSGALGAATLLFLFVCVIFGSVYYMSQRIVRKQLEPRRQELLTLLASLSDQSASEVSGEYPILLGGKRVTCSRRRMIFAGLIFVVLLSIGVGGIRFSAGREDGFPKLAPFTGVRWGGDIPVVKIDGESHVLFAIDEIAVKDIVAYCKRTYGDKWQKRFGEDLVEVLITMGHEPSHTVRLDVLSTGPQAARTIKEVPMTAANRRAVRAAAEKWNAAQAQLTRLAQERAVPIEEPGSSAPLSEALETIRASYELPAMAAFVLRDGAIVERAAVGTRSAKDGTPVGDDAPWHLGSNTKAMTATVAGVLVEEGLLAWDVTIGDVLGKAAPGMDAGHRDTTLAMLLHHTGGITPNINWFDAPTDRVACAARVLSTPPANRGNYVYSNGGYVVAGAMMEVVTGERWEDLMRERLFEPLGMEQTGFGAPAGPNAPWGHSRGLFGWKPMDPAERGSDNAPVMGPAGTVHATLDDYAGFLTAHLEGARGKDGIVSAETYATLHTPPEGGDYAMGWIVVDRSWADGRAFSHSGSNTLWYASVWLAPEKNMAFFAATNAGGDRASEAVDNAIETLIDRHMQR